MNNFRPSRLSNFQSLIKLPLGSRTSLNVKCLKLLVERERTQMKTFFSYSAIVAKNLTQRFHPFMNNNQNYVEKRNIKKKVNPINLTHKKSQFKEEEFESSNSFESNVDQSTRKKTKSVYFRNTNEQSFSHQSSNISPASKSTRFRKSLFSRKKETKCNIFIDCYGNEHPFEEMRKVINVDIENSQEAKNFDDMENHEEYLKIRVKIKY